MVTFYTGKLNRLRMKVQILVNSSIRKVDSIAFKWLMKVRFRAYATVPRGLGAHIRHINGE